MFKTEKEELDFYRKLFSNLNAAIYVINLNPYRLEWITDNDVNQKVLGMSQAEIIAQGDKIVAKLFSNLDFTESIEIAVEKFENDPNIAWAGVYRIRDEVGGFKWIIYSTSTLARDSAGHATKAVCVAFDPDDLLNTPKTLDAFLKHLKSRSYLHLRDSFTQRQRDIIQLILEKKTENEISKKLNLSIYTIKDHKKAIYKKLNCTTTKELYTIANEYLSL